MPIFSVSCSIEELKPYKKRGIQLLNLRNLTRQHENITGVMIQTRLQFQAVLEQVFPEYKGVFGDLYSVVSLLTLSEFSSSIERASIKVRDRDRRSRKEIEEYNIIKSIPGIGEKIAATIISESGEIDR